MAHTRLLVAALLTLTVTLPASATVGAIIVQSVSETSDTPTPTDNDYTRINNALQAALDGDTIELQGTFDWTETHAAASWAAGSDGTLLTGDDYYLEVPPTDNLTITAASLGAATIQGPGDLPGVDLEGVFIFLSAGGGGDFLNLTISNLTILDFDLSIGMFHNGGSINAFDNSLITNNFIRMPQDLSGNFGLPAGEPFQNIGIHFAFGDNQTISNNVIEIPGDSLSDRSDVDSANHLLAASVGMQSNTSGGAYEGLLIDGNEIRILNAQSADPENIYGIWENGHAHTSNITVSNNRFLNLDPGNDPALNIQNAFRVSSHSSTSSTVTYSGNEAQGTNVGLAQMLYSTPIDFSGHEPIQVLGNTFLDNESAVLVRAGGNDVLRCNRFFGNGLAIGNEGTLADADAAENWFGCNAGPGFGACDPIDGTVDAPRWLTLGLSIDDPSLAAGETALVTADVVRHSGGGLATCTLPNGAETIFDTSNGTMSPESVALSSGIAQSTYTAGGADGLGNVVAFLDGEVQALFVSVTATETDLAITKSNGRPEADPGTAVDYEIVVTNQGPSDVAGATVTDVLPPELLGCTWTCTPGAGGACTANGVGGIDDLVDLDAGSSLQYDLSCTLQAAVGDTVLNTATVAVPPGITEIAPSNDSATDTTHVSLSIFADGFESGNVQAWAGVRP